MQKKVMNPSIDEKVFRATAIKSKKINVEPMFTRGGIRL